jgi:hypothetical protein
LAPTMNDPAIFAAPRIPIRKPMRASISHHRPRTFAHQSTSPRAARRDTLAASTWRTR